MVSDSVYMQQAVAAAKKGAGQTWTNPLVGAVLVRAGRVLAVGYHHRFGQAHAEVDALNQVADAHGATLYVTLEPCSHYGKTPPCAKRVIAAGINRVVIGQVDPNPLVAGRGIAMLQDAGIDVAVLHTSGGLNTAYNFFYQHQRPLVTIKYAASLDGKLNAAGGERTHLTAGAAAADGQALRASQQAVLIGEHTLLIDDPRLTVRTQTLAHPPIRVVLVDDADRLALTLHLFADPAPVWLLSRHESKRQWPNQVRVFVDAQWQPAAIVRLLAEHGIQSLLVEGGSRVHAAFVAADLSDRLVVYLAPVVLGGTALPLVQGAPLASPQHFHLTACTPLGEALKLDYRRKA